MNIIIAGGGKVGITLARQLASEKHDLTLIDQRRNVLESAEGGSGGELPVRQSHQRRSV